jgi:hypothetical protein
MNWSAVLDSFEARLAAATAVLDDPDEALAPSVFEPPAGLPPCPPELLPRVQALLASSADLEARVRSRADGVKDELLRIPRRTTSGPAARRFETHA